MPAPKPADCQLVTDIQPEALSPRQITSRFRARLAQCPVRPAGEGREDPEALVASYRPRALVRLFDAEYWLSDMHHDDYVNFMVAYVGLRKKNGVVPALYPRIFYKDSSLVWRVASHFIWEEDEHWIGKGDVRWEQREDGEYLTSAEETTNLPYELQAAFDQVSRRKTSRYDPDAVPLVLRRAKPNRTQPFADFTGPRKKAAERAQIHGGKPVARFRRAGDPASLYFAKGFEPDFRKGLIEVQASGSRLYGGAIRKYRFLSTNRQIQYQVVASPTHVFVNHPQTLTTEIMSYGTRTLDVHGDDDAFLPGFEYHFYDESTDPPQLYSQIPAGFAGVVGDPDPERADASPWLERLPTVRAFRRIVWNPSKR